MKADTDIEIVSPLNHWDTDCVCRVSRIPGLVATCAGCSETVYRRVHLPLIAFGFWCSRCCPCRTFVPTPEEAHALGVNRARCLQAAASEDDAGGERDAGSKAPPKPRNYKRRSHKAIPLKPGESMEERRARFKQRCSESARARWADPAKRAQLLQAIQQGMGRAR